MQVQLTKPELQKFIDEQVRAGRYSSAQAVVEAAVEQMMLDGEAYELDDRTAEAINRGEEQIDRGEGIDFHQFAAELRKKFPAG
jgi:putative addiction module CopG family antidote